MIKWEGYPVSKNSWEPEENLTPDMVEEFNSAQMDTVAPASARKRTHSKTSVDAPAGECDVFMNM